MRRRTQALRLIVLAALVAVGLVAVLDFPARAGNPRGAYYSPAADRVFWFVHFSDPHIGARGTQDSANLAWMVTTAKTVINPSFIVASGDLTDSTNGSWLGIPNGPYQAEWDQYKSILDPNVTADLYFDLPGNHDAYSDKTFAYYRANSVQGRATGGTQVSWTRNFTFGKYHFLGVNSCQNAGAAFSLSWPWGDYAGLDADELAYIDGRLRDPLNSDSNLTFVFGHHPVTDTGASDDTWLYYGHQDFVGYLDLYRASLYGYGHTHLYSDVHFTGDAYTGPMHNGGVRYLNIASVGKSSSNHYDIVAVDCDGISSVAATVNTWPVVLVTAPVTTALGGNPNPYAYTVPAAPDNPVRALVFDAKTVSAVQFRVDSETTWHPMTRVASGQPLWQGVWNASSLAAGNHTLTVQATGTSTRSHTITVTVDASVTPNRAPVAGNDAYSVDQGSVLSVAAPGVLGNDTDPDGDPLTAVIEASVTHGSLTFGANGAFTYTPATGYSGPDSFTYKASDGLLLSGVATVSITVNAVVVPDEKVTILTANYRTKTKQLVVEATSDRQPDVALTVDGYGAMTYDPSRNLYALTKKVTTAPASVTVSSSGGGSATKTVTKVK